MDLKEYFREIRLFVENFDPSNSRSVSEFVNAMLIPTRQIFDPTSHDKRLYSFRASDSYGFSAYPCAALECRLGKIEELSIFAALYANKISIANPFEKFLDSDQSSLDDFELFCELTILLTLEPFAEFGMIGMRNSYISICTDHKAEMIEIKKAAAEKYSLVAAIFQDEYKKCNAVVKMHPERGYHYVQVTGDARLIDHDAVDLVGPAAKKAYKLFGYESIDSDYLVENLMSGFIASAAQSVVEAEFERFFNGGTFLTSRDIESSALDLAGEAIKPSAVREVTSSLRHNIPYIENITVWKMLEFREGEGEKFENYRDAVKRAMREYDEKSRDKSEIVNDIILPEINKIGSIMKRYKESQQKSAVFDIGLGLGGLAIGVSGVANPALSTILSAIGGLATLRSIGQKVIDLNSPPKEAFDNDYYFLWKMNKTYNS